MNKSIGGIVNFSKMLVQGMEEAKEQEIKHLSNPRCKKPSFANAHFALCELAVRMNLTPPTEEETENLISGAGNKKGIDLCKLHKSIFWSFCLLTSIIEYDIMFGPLLSVPGRICATF